MSGAEREDEGRQARALIAALAALQVLCDELDQEMRYPAGQRSAKVALFMAGQIEEKARRVRNRVRALVGHAPLDIPGRERSG